MATPEWQARISRDLRSFYAFSQRRTRLREIEMVLRAKRQSLAQYQRYLKTYPGSARHTKSSENAQREIARLEALRNELNGWTN